jgi:hypothetical protein
VREVERKMLSIVMCMCRGFIYTFPNLNLHPLKPSRPSQPTEKDETQLSALNSLVMMIRYASIKLREEEARYLHMLPTPTMTNIH